MAFSPVRHALMHSPGRRFATDASMLGDDTRHTTTRPSTSPAVSGGAYNAAEVDNIRARSARRAATPQRDYAFTAVHRTTPFLELPQTPDFYDVKGEEVHAPTLSKARCCCHCAASAN